MGKRSASPHAENGMGRVRLPSLTPEAQSAIPSYAAQCVCRQGEREREISAHQVARPPAQRFVLELVGVRVHEVHVFVQAEVGNEPVTCGRVGDVSGWSQPFNRNTGVPRALRCCEIDDQEFGDLASLVVPYVLDRERHVVEQTALVGQQQRAQVVTQTVPSSDEQRASARGSLPQLRRCTLRTRRSGGVVKAASQVDCPTPLQRHSARQHRTADRLEHEPRLQQPNRSNKTSHYVCAVSCVSCVSCVCTTKV